MRPIISRVAILLCLAVLVAGCASTSSSGSHDQNYNFASVNRVAVVSVTGVSGGVANQIANIFNQELLSRGYSPVERTQIRAVIEEQQFSNSSLTRASGAAKLGRILNVPVVVIVNVPVYGDKMEMGAKMVDVDSGRIIWIANGVADTGDGLNEVVGALAGAAVGAAAGQAVDSNTRNTVIGAGAGAVVGGVVGSAMTPQRQEQAHKLIDELLSTLPQG